MSKSKVTLKPFNPKETSKNRDYKWAVYFPNDEPGKTKKKKYFVLKRDAVAFRDLKEVDTLNAGRDGGSLTAKASREAAWAAKALESYGIGIQEVVKDFIARKERDDRSITVLNAVDECIKHKRKNGASTPHLHTMSHKLALFVKAFGERFVSDISTQEVDQWLQGLTHAPVTRRGYRAVVVGLFSWADKQGYCEGNPAARTDLPKLKKNREPEIFTPEQLLIVLNGTPGELIPLVTIQAFAGLRPGEADSLDWQDVDLLRNEISVDPIGKKGSSHRTVPIHPSLKAWLKPLAQARGKIAPRNLKRRLLNYHRALREDPDNPVTHVQHILRHSYASYAMAEKKDSATVSFLLGHSDKDTLFRHYRKRVSEEEAEAWFSTLPEKGDKIVSMKEAI